MAHISENIELLPVIGYLITIGRKHRRTAGLTDKLVANQKELRRFVKFALVGTSGTVVDFSTLNFVHLVLGGSLFVSNTISFSFAVINNFIWNRLWTFPESQKKPVGTQLMQFVAVNMVGLVINQAVFLSLNHYVFRPWFGPLGYNFAKACAILVVLFWNFAINRIWTYKGIR